MAIKFEIYRQGTRLMSFEPAGATAIGPESVPIPGEVQFHDGLLIVNRKDEHATGVSLLWDCGAAGAFVMETTRLPPRDKPYNLNVELARFRLMRILQKQEDWALFDFPKAEKFSTRFHEAQMLFADALGHLDEAEEAARLADQALAIGMELSDQLAAFHADLFISRRKTANSFVKHIFGCRVNPTIQNEKFRETLASHFDYAVLPISWRHVQPQEHAFNLQELDEWIEMLSRRRMPIIAGPLVRLDQQNVPDWMVIWEHDFDMLREMAYEYVQKIVTRYRKAFAAWNVVADLQTNAAFTLSFEQVIELTRLLVSQVKTLLPGVRTLVTVSHPFGEYHARGRASVPPMLYAEMVAQAGIGFDAFGLELEMGVPRQGMFMRDLFQLSALLDKFSTLGRPVSIVALEVPGRASPDPNDQSEGQNAPDQGGRWRRAWDPQLQAEWMDAVYHMALSKPFVESIAWGNLADISPVLPAGGLLDDMLQPKPAFNKLTQMREKFRPHQRKA